MPEYRATRFINTREADTYDFSAANDQEALEMLLLATISPGAAMPISLIATFPTQFSLLTGVRTTAVTRPSQRKSSFLAKSLMASPRGISCGKPPNLAKRAPIATLSKPC